MTSTPVRVLLVDDHPVMRDGLQQLLERTGEFEVVGHAGDGEEAERVAKEVVPDLIIMDVLMPGRDGIDACREIIDALADVRVLMLTASTEKDAVIEAVAAGADGRRRRRLPSEVHRDGAAVGHGQGRRRRRIPDAPGRDETGIQAAAPPAGGCRFATAEGADIEGEGDTRAVRAGDVLRRHRRVQGQPLFDGPQHHLPHTGKAGIRQQAGDRRLSRAKRTGGPRARLNFSRTNSP